MISVSWRLRWTTARNLLCNYAPTTSTLHTLAQRFISSVQTTPSTHATTVRRPSLHSSIHRTTALTPKLRRPRFAPPSEEQLNKLRQRLDKPYITTSQTHRLPIHSTGECRVLCLDVGDRYVGVAISDGGNRIARPLTTVFRREDVARPEVSAPKVHRPLSPHSHHAKWYDRRAKAKPHTDLRTRHAGIVVDRPIELVLNEIQQLLQQHHCVAIVIGMPLTLGFKMGTQCTKTIDFANQLQRFLREFAKTRTSTDTAFLLPEFLYWDERLSSSDAKQQLGARGLTGRTLARHSDAFAAATILQEFLHRLHL